MKVNCMAEDNSDEGLKESMRLALTVKVPMTRVWSYLTYVD